MQTMLQSPAAIVVDSLAQRYGRLPHELLAGDYGDFLLDLGIAEAGAEHEKQLVDEAKAQGAG